MLKVMFPDGVDVFSADLDGTESYRQLEVLRRWNHQVDTPGIVANSYDANILMPSTGSSLGEIAVSAGGAYMPSGEYVYCSGASLTGLTDADLFTGNTYVAIQHYRMTGDTRPHMIGAVMYPTREWNAGDASCLALVSGAGASHIILAKVDDITPAGEVTLDTGSTYRTLMRMSSISQPSTPGGLVVVTGPESGLIHSGTTRARRVESTLAYVSLSWDVSTHAEGILAYYVRLDVLDNDDTINTGKSQSLLLYVGSGDTTPAYTGVTFHNLTPGLKAQASVYALSDVAIPVASIPATSSTFYIGSGGTLTMPALAIIQRASGCEVTWDPSDAGVSGAVMFEVFVSGSSAFTGASIDYSSLIYRGYGKRAFIPGDIGDTVYIMARAVDYSGAVSTAVITSTTMTGPTAPPAPASVRLSGVRFPELSDLECSDLYKADRFSVAMKGGGFGSRAMTVWDWNWDSLIGQGGANGQFSITNGSGITANQLVGLHLWAYSNATDYVITSNTASNVSGNLVIGVTDVLGQPVDVSGVTATANNPAVVHSDADEYEVEFREYTDDGSNSELATRRMRLNISQSESPLPQSVEVSLPLGSRQQCIVWAKERATGNSSSGATSDIERIYYDNNELWNTYGNVSALGTEYGFEITMSPGAVLDQISGWEIAYHLGTSGVSFSNMAHNPRVFPPLETIRFPVERAATYEIAVRPVVGGQVVGQRKTARVASGGGGYLPNRKSYTVKVDLRPLTQRLVYDTGTTQVYVSGESGVAITGSNPVSTVDGKYFGCTATGNSYVYFVRNQRSAVENSQLKQVLELYEITSIGTPLDQVFPTGVGLTVYFGGANSTGATVQRVREIAQIAVPNDIKIVRLLFQPYYTDATDVDPAIIRVYQQGMDSNATSIEIPGNVDTVIEQEADLDITRTQGALIVVVDAFDPNVASHNNHYLIGRLEIEYRDTSVKTSTSTAGAGGYAV